MYAIYYSDSPIATPTNSHFSLSLDGQNGICRGFASQAISSNAACDGDIVAHLVGPLAKWPKIWLPTNGHNFMSNFGSQPKERAGLWMEWRIRGRKTARMATDDVAGKVQ